MIPEFIYNPPHTPTEILYCDRDILVAGKPAGLLSVPGKFAGREDCLLARLTMLFYDALLVHRLDCDTSGVMIFARNKRSQGFLGQEFEQRRAHKTYIARLSGRLQKDHGIVDLPICADWENRPRQIVNHKYGRSAQTKWQVLERDWNETRVLLTPITGRSHQLRVHMQEIGHPILGDSLYNAVQPVSSSRLMLHAYDLSLHHPTFGNRVYFKSFVPF